MENKDCVIVTGAARGIGRAIALDLAKAGYAVVINYAHSQDASQTLQQEIQALGGESLLVKADVSDFNQAKLLIETAKQTFNQIYGLVNNAGITRDGLIMRMSEADFDDVMTVNLKGAFNCVRHVSGIMARARRGRIINISSVAGIMGNAGQANYSASKAGLIGMTKAVARELSSRNISVNAIAPGLVRSDMTDHMPKEAREKMLNTVPLKRIAEPEEIAKLVTYLCSEYASYITGQVIAIDGGLSI